MSDAAKAYTRTANTTASPREIEARALLKAAKQLNEVVTDWSGPDERMRSALMFNRKLWTIFMSAAMEDSNPQPREVRENVANIGIFVMKQTSEMQVNPDPRKLLPLININLNLAAGLAGRP
jgi:flagellar biosynthesis activator protein FlaF